ncbi:MAG: hypothetical protein AB7G48_10565 [Nitrospiraceae bacterium]
MKSTPLPRMMSVWLSVLALILLVPDFGRAEGEIQPELPDRFMIRGGYGLVFNADTIFRFNGASGVGATVDFADTLGGSRDDSFWRIDAQYRFNDRHSLGFSYYDVDRDGNRTLTQDITIGDTTYAAGGAIQSKLDIQLYRLIYNYSFYHNDKVELGISPGLYVAKLDTLFAGNLVCAGGPSCAGGTIVASSVESQKLTVPLPSIGVLLNYNITTRLKAQLRFDWFYLEVNTLKGSMNEFYAGLEYRLFKHFAVGGAFDRLSIDVDYKPKDESGWGVRNDWATAFLYGALYF